jgi:hypothetical protein
MLQRGEHTLLRCARMPSQRRSACRLAAQCELVAAEVPASLCFPILSDLPPRVYRSTRTLFSSSSASTPLQCYGLLILRMFYVTLCVSVRGLLRASAA